MATTPNFGWETPDDTDYVKDGAAAMRTLGNAIDASLMDLEGGTTGQVLSKNSNTDMDFIWVTPNDADAIQNTIVDAKGDLITATGADVPARLGVGTNGQILQADSTTATGLKWADPVSGALTWTLRKPANSSGDAFFRIGYNGSNLWVAVGANGQLWTSPDAKTWTSRTSSFGGARINAVTYGGGLWCAVGNSGLIATSSDGITWTQRTSNMGTNIINDVTYASGRFVAVGAGGGSTNTGGVTSSTDGFTWSRVSMTPLVGTTYYAVVWNGTNFLIGTQAGTNNALYSSNGTSWTATQLFSNLGTIDGLWYDGTRTLGSTGGFITSDTAALPTTATYFYEQNFGLIAPQPTTSTMSRAMVYSNTIYMTNSWYYINGTTVPNTVNNGGTHTVPSLTPNVRMTDGNTSPGYAQIGTGVTIWAGANGVIITSGLGEIFTSF